MKTIKTEEAKLREEIEKLIKEKIGSMPISLPPYIRKLILKKELKAKLQQILADKKMFQDAVRKEIKLHKEHYPKLSVYARAKHRHTIIILNKLLKTLGLGEMK